MGEKIEIADGFISLNERVWVTGKKLGDITIDRGYIKSVYNDPFYGKLANVMIEFNEGGNIDSSGYSIEDLKIYWFKDLDNAHIKHIELVLCDEGEEGDFE